MLASLGFAVFGFIVFVAVQGYFLNQTGQTIAKKLLKMKIVDENGKKPEFVKLTGLRYAVVQLAQIVPFLGSSTSSSTRSSSSATTAAAFPICWPAPAW